MGVGEAVRWFSPVWGSVKNETLRSEGTIVLLLGLALQCTMAFARQVVMDVSFLAVVKNRCPSPLPASPRKKEKNSQATRRGLMQ